MLVQNVYDPSVVNTSQNAKKEKRFLCNVCCKQFQHKGNLNSHMRSHTGERPYSCDVCEKRFSTSGILKTHMRTHTGEKPYLCDTCGKRFSHIGILKNHMLTHSGERPHRCPIPDCGKDYSRAANLKIHMRSHTGERPFKCEHPKCDWSFASNADLKIHLKSHSGSKPLTCNVLECKKEFSDNADLKNHIISHSEMNLKINEENSYPKADMIRAMPEKTPNYDWKILESEFKKIDSHAGCRRTYPSQKPYACSMCPTAYSTIAKLKLHIKEHDTTCEARPYKCGECSRKFSQPRNIHRHLVLSHGKAETTGPFTLALMSPEKRIPFSDKNCQTDRGQKRPLDELHKSAFTPVAKSPNTTPDLTPTKPALNPAQLYITNVKSLKEVNPFPDIKPLAEESADLGNPKIKEEKRSPRHHPYSRPSPTKIAPRPTPRLAPKPPQYAIIQAVKLPTVQAFPIKVETRSPPPSIQAPQMPLSQPRIATPPQSRVPTPMSTRIPTPPARIHTPENLHSITMVDQIRYAAILATFDHMVQGYRAHQTYQTLKSFYKCLTTAKTSVELGKMPW